MYTREQSSKIRVYVILQDRDLFLVMIVTNTFK